jgi:hypothetical protein
VKKEGKGKINDKAGWLGLLHCCLVDYNQLQREQVKQAAKKASRS